MLAYQPSQSLPIIGGGGAKNVWFFTQPPNCDGVWGIPITINEYKQSESEWRVLPGGFDVWRGLPNLKFDGVCPTTLSLTGFAKPFEVCYVLTVHFFQNLPRFEPKWPLAPHLINLVHVLLWDLIFQKGTDVEPQAWAPDDAPCPFAQLSVRVSNDRERKGLFFKQFRIKKSSNHKPYPHLHLGWVIRLHSAVEIIVNSFEVFNRCSFRNVHHLWPNLLSLVSCEFAPLRPRHIVALAKDLIRKA